MTETDETTRGRIFPDLRHSMKSLTEHPLPLCLCSLPQIAETYAFLPREAVTRFLMSCGECQKRMHISTTTQDCKGTNGVWV